MVTCANKEFADLFFKVTGLKPEETTSNKDGWVFIPPSVQLEGKDPKEREALGKFGWKNHLENDEYAGWWVNPWP